MKQPSRFKIVSFFTPDYEEHALRLLRSLKKWLPQQQHEIEPIEQAAWARATCMKGAFVRDKLAASDQPVLWIDADAEVRGALTFPEVDFAIYARFADRLRNAWSPFRTGTVFFGKTPAAQRLADMWAEECERQRDGIDQWALYRAWARLTSKPSACPSTAWLPLSYCRKDDEAGEALILHHMASRQLRRSKSL